MNNMMLNDIRAGCSQLQLDDDNDIDQWDEPETQQQESCAEVAQKIVSTPSFHLTKSNEATRQYCDEEKERNMLKKVAFVDYNGNGRSRLAAALCTKLHHTYIHALAVELLVDHPPISEALNDILDNVNNLNNEESDIVTMNELKSMNVQVIILLDDKTSDEWGKHNYLEGATILKCQFNSIPNTSNSNSNNDDEISIEIQNIRDDLINVIETLPDMLM